MSAGIEHRKVVASVSARTSKGSALDWNMDSTSELL